MKDGAGTALSYNGMSISKLSNAMQKGREVRPFCIAAECAFANEFEGHFIASVGVLQAYRIDFRSYLDFCRQLVRVLRIFVKAVISGCLQVWFL